MRGDDESSGRVGGEGRVRGEGGGLLAIKK